MATVGTGSEGGSSVSELGLLPPQDALHPQGLMVICPGEAAVCDAGTRPFICFCLCYSVLLLRKLPWHTVLAVALAPAA